MGTMAGASSSADEVRRIFGDGAQIGTRNNNNNNNNDNSISKSSKNAKVSRLSRDTEVLVRPGQSVNFFTFFLKFLIVVLISVLKKAPIHKFT